jgi:hypothetical protein
VVSTPLKNMKVNGKDDNPYIMENKSHVPNHQPVEVVQFFSPDTSLRPSPAHFKAWNARIGRLVAMNHLKLVKISGLR